MTYRKQQKHEVLACDLCNSATNSHLIRVSENATVKQKAEQRK